VSNGQPKTFLQKIKKYLTTYKKYDIIIIENKERQVLKMKDFKRGKWNYDINKALESAGYKPTKENKKVSKKA